MNWLFIAALVSIVLIPLLTWWGCYNSLVARRNKAFQGLSGIFVQLKRRADLIPNLVEVVQGYAQHERTTLERMTELRRTLLATPQTDAAALQQLTKETGAMVARLLAIAESYPDLKASANYRKLQEELAETEDQIAAARRIYNANVTDYNTAREQFPTNAIADRHAFTALPLFEGTEALLAVPRVAGI